MSSDRKKALPRLFATLAIATAALSLAGCQVRPLYDSTGVTAQRLGALSFSEANTRVEQVTRNRLIFLTTGGAGEDRKSVV